MAKYMLTENAFLPDGRLHEASLEKPEIIELPDDLPPSFKWMPLDEAAQAALELLREEKMAIAVAGITDKEALRGAKILADRQLRIKPMPKGIEKVHLPANEIKNIEVRKAKTHDELEREALDKMVKAAAGVPQTTQSLIAELAKASGRPSDNEPT